MNIPLLEIDNDNNNMIINFDQEEDKLDNSNMHPLARQSTFPSAFLINADTRPYSIRMDDDPIRLKMKLIFNRLLEYGFKSNKIS